jgi:hypothetical protein
MNRTGSFIGSTAPTGRELIMHDHGEVRDLVEVGMMPWRMY